MTHKSCIGIMKSASIQLSYRKFSVVREKRLPEENLRSETKAWSEKRKNQVWKKKGKFKKIWEGTLMPSLFDSFFQCLGRGKGFSSPVGRKTRAGGHEHKPRWGNWGEGNCFCLTSTLHTCMLPLFVHFLCSSFYIFKHFFSSPFPLLRIHIKMGKKSAHRNGGGRKKYRRMRKSSGESSKEKRVLVVLFFKLTLMLRHQSNLSSTLDFRFFFSWSFKSRFFFSSNFHHFGIM